MLTFTKGLAALQGYPHICIITKDKTDQNKYDIEFIKKGALAAREACKIPIYSNNAIKKMDWNSLPDKFIIMTNNDIAWSKIAPKMDELAKIKKKVKPKMWKEKYGMFF